MSDRLRRAERFCGLIYDWPGSGPSPLVPFLQDEIAGIQRDMEGILALRQDRKATKAAEKKLRMNGLPVYGEIKAPR